MSETPLTLPAQGGAGEPTTGIALVSGHPFSPRYDLDRTTGVISRDEHDLAGQSIAGTVLIVPAPKGGVAAGWALYALASDGLAPRAFVFTTINPVFVQGAVHAGITLLHGFASDPAHVVRNGDLVRVDPESTNLTLLERPPTPTATR